jgi:hypothetical protein
MRRSILILPISIFLTTSCSRDLTPEVASEQLAQHLLSLAPQYLSTDSVTVAVEGVRAASTDVRDVTFRIALATVDSAHTVVVDTSNAMRARFQRNGKRWALQRYEGELKDWIASVVAGQRWLEWHYLLEPLRLVDSAYMAQEHARMQRAGAALRARNLAAYYELQRPLAIAVVENAVAALGTAIPDSLVWGYEPPLSREENAVLWVALRRDSSHICAQAKGLATFAAGSFYWVDALSPTCHTREGYVAMYGMQDTVLAIIEREGGNALRP